MVGFDTRGQRGPRRRPDEPPRRAIEARVPPHNLDAEESLLGALLLSRDAVNTATELGLGAADFYKPAHQHVYEAIRVLMAAGEPVDAVTVADELRRSGLLDEIGGRTMLLDLQNATPAISNVGRYASIVQDTASLRRLIAVASDIAEMAYDEPDDVRKAIDSAEQKVFDIAEQRDTDSTMADQRAAAARPRPISRSTTSRESTITGTPTG